MQPYRVGDEPLPTERMGRAFAALIGDPLDREVHMTASFDASALRQAIHTSEPPHSTICFVREVTDTHVEVKFRAEADGVWVRLPVEEIAWATILRQMTTVTGEYSVVELGLNDSHPQTEIAALEAQVRQLQDQSRQGCGCTGAQRHMNEMRSEARARTAHAGIVAEESNPFPPTEPCPQCHGLTGCANWRCHFHCILGI